MRCILALALATVFGCDEVRSGLADGGLRISDAGPEPDARPRELTLLPIPARERVGDYERVLLPTLKGVVSEAVAVDDAGVIYGWAETIEGLPRAVKWVDGELIDLSPALGAHGRISYVVAANGRGDVIMRGGDGGALTQTVIVMLDGVVHVTDIVFAHTISNDGTVLGTKFADEAGDMSVVWRNGIHHEVGIAEPVGIADDGTVYVRDADYRLYRWREDEGRTEIPSAPQPIELGYIVSGDGKVVGRSESEFVMWDGSAWTILDIPETLRWSYVMTRTGWMWLDMHPDVGDDTYLRRPDGIFVALEHSGGRYAGPSALLDDGTAFGRICSNCENLSGRPALWRPRDGGQMTYLGPIGCIQAAGPNGLLVGYVPADVDFDWKRAAMWVYNPR